VPIIPTILDEIKYLFRQEVKLKGGIIATMLMMDEEGTIYFSAIFLVYCLPTLSVVIFYYMMKSAFDGDDD
jgi:hypothetical protein